MIGHWCKFKIKRYKAENRKNDYNQTFKDLNGWKFDFVIQLRILFPCDFNCFCQWILKIAGLFFEESRISTRMRKMITYFWEIFLSKLADGGLGPFI